MKGSKKEAETRPASIVHRAACVPADGRAPENENTRRAREAFLAVARPLLGEGLDICFTVTGRSMRPFLKEGDLITATPAGKLPRCGGIVLAELEGGGLMVHRVTEIRGAKDGDPRVLLSGDGLYGHDVEIPACGILAEVRGVTRGGRHLGTRDRLAGIWRSLRGVRHALARLYHGILRRVRNPPP